ncbi:alkaline phosphatase D family protein [Candidatus Bathyarchaeota archaeon]|nr:alkaline phosphatase D family protein [Candidatus Bathyarchaeota archaeon]
MVWCIGEYIYEYPNEEFGDGTKMDRIPELNRELLTLYDYRKRHATYAPMPISLTPTGSSPGLRFGRQAGSEI